MPGGEGGIGPYGPPGSTGPQGQQGIQGLQGPTGPPGTAIALSGSVATVAGLPTTAPNGTCYYVQPPTNAVYVYDSVHGWVSMGAIMGPAGPAGSTGATGSPGGQGVAGPTGPPGATGPQGSQGSTGAPGPQGTGITVKGSVVDPSHLPSAANSGDVYYVQSNGHLYVYGQGGWSDMGLAAGPPGPPGPAGIQGPTGAQGVAGTAGQMQSPWLNDENASSFQLYSLKALRVNAPNLLGGAPVYVSTASLNTSGVQIADSTTIGFAGLNLETNESGNGSGITMYGSQYPSTTAVDPNLAGNTVINALHDILLSPQQTEAVRIKGGTGYIGLGVKTPSHLLELAQDSAAKPSTSTWQILSDPRTKRNLHSLEGGLAIINQLKPTEAEYNGAAGTQPGSRVVSLDPREVREVLPHTVTAHRGRLNPEDPEETEILHFNPHEVLFHLILAVQQLSKRLATADS